MKKETRRDRDMVLSEIVENTKVSNEDVLAYFSLPGSDVNIITETYVTSCL